MFDIKRNKVAERNIQKLIAIKRDARFVSQGDVFDIEIGRNVLCGSGRYYTSPPQHHQQCGNADEWVKFVEKNAVFVDEEKTVYTLCYLLHRYIYKYARNCACAIDPENTQEINNVVECWNRDCTLLKRKDENFTPVVLKEYDGGSDRVTTYRNITAIIDSQKKLTDITRRQIARHEEKGISDECVDMLNETLKTNNNKKKK